MAVGFDIMNMILVKRHCLLERVWKRLSASYFYGRRGCEVQPGYAKFYSRLVSLRHVASSISDAVEGVEGLEMLVPGAEA